MTRKFASKTQEHDELSIVKPPIQMWDTHMHVVDPRFSFVKTATYKPKHWHTLEDANYFYQKAFGITDWNAVFVQPSIYGSDNSCLLDALRKIGPKRGRGVVDIEPESIDRDILLEWNELGVRGVRINLKSGGEDFTAVQINRRIEGAANVLEKHGINWHLDLYCDMYHIPDMKDLIMALNRPVVFAHFGSPGWSKGEAAQLDNRRTEPLFLPGFNDLLYLIKNHFIWLKLSAPYRVAPDVPLKGIFEELLRVQGSPDHLMFATDWPHTRFEDVDIMAFTQDLLKWCETNGSVDEIKQAIFCRNAEKFYE
jgi:predicted TIM-barrel fold metal-dependent hydrolase